MGPQGLYNGQTVSAIDLIANPHRDVEPLRGSVVQKAGEPYDQEKVLASISALQQKGDFDKVTVNVIPDTSGLRLNVLLEAAYYLGMIDFQGVAKSSFSYGRLLQVVNLQEEDPYDAARIPLAQEALLRFLQHDGYFRAKVDVESQIDDSHESTISNLSAQGSVDVGGVSVDGKFHTKF